MASKESSPANIERYVAIIVIRLTSDHSSRTLGSRKNTEDRLLFSKRQGLQVQGSCHTSPLPSLISLMVSVDVKHHVYLLTYASPGICKLCLAPKQHQADQPPRVCTAKGSMVDTTETVSYTHLTLPTIDDV